MRKRTEAHYFRHIWPEHPERGGSGQGSSLGSTIGMVLGAVIGAVLALPTGGTSVWAGLALGASIGGAVGGVAGGIIDAATQRGVRNEQETVADLFIQTSALGTPIPQLFGHGRLSGNVFYLGERFVVEHEQPRGGKGGGSDVSVTNTYEIDLAIALCETEISGPIAGIRRIWRDGTLWYDLNGRHGTGILPENLTFYNGAAFQVPSPMIEAAKGVGNVPGYPYLCYVTLNNYDMGPFPRVPNFTFELNQDSSPVSALHQLLWRSSTDEIYASAPGTNQVLVYHGTTQDLSRAIDVARITLGNPPARSRPKPTSLGFPLAWDASGTALWVTHPGDYLLKQIDLSSNTVTALLSSNYSLLTAGLPLAGDMWWCAWDYQSKWGYLLRGNAGGIVATILCGQARDGHMKATVPGTGEIWVTDNHYPNGGGESWVKRISPVTNTIQQGIVLGPAADSSPVDILTDTNGMIWVLDAAANNMRKISTVTNTIVATVAVGAGGLQLAVASDGYIWVATTASGGTVYRIHPTTHATTTIETLPLSLPSQAHPILTPGVGGSMWVLSVPKWVTQRIAPDGTVLQVSTEGSPRGQVAQNGGTSVWTANTRGGLYQFTDAGVKSIAPSPVSTRLRGVLTNLCGAAGLAPEALDLTRIENPHVAFKLVNVQTVRSVIEMLMKGYLFFAIESNLQLKFLTREPGDIEATIREDELDAYDADQDEPPVQRGLRIGPRLTDEELPTELRLSYVSRQRNYQEDTKVAYVSNSRAAAKNSRAVALSLVLTAVQAQRLAQESLDQLWLQRFPYAFTVNRDYAHLEPGDRVRVTSRGIVHSIILTDISYQRPGIVECLGRGDTTGVINVQPAFAGASGLPSGLPIPVAHTAGILLNLPAMTAADQDPRFHVAYGYTPTFWRGATLFRSADGELTYRALHTTQQIRATAGTVATALSAGDWHVFDDVNTFTVVLTSGGPLQSVSDEELFDGLNTAYLNGEVLQFGTATLVGANTYTCSHLLRGRRGTEWATTTHVANETFVLLNAGVHAVAMFAANRGVVFPFKTVTHGIGISTVTPVNFAATGENLRPWSPADVEAVRNGNDWVMTWLPRSRFAGEWTEEEVFGYDPDLLHFRIRIYSDNTYSAIVRTLTVPLGPDPEDWQWATYDAATQTADFGSVQSSLYFRVAQVGRYATGRSYSSVGVS